MPRSRSQRRSLATALSVWLVGAILSSCQNGTTATTVELSLASQDVVVAIQQERDAVEAAPDNADAHGRLGIALEVNGFMHAALASYRRATALDLEAKRWLYYQALLEASLASRDTALTTMQKVAQLDPFYAPVWLWQGTWLLELNRPDEAAESFDRAIELGSILPGRVGASRVMLYRGEVDEAVRAIEDIAQDYPLPYVRQLLATAYTRSKRQTEAATLSAGTHGAEPLRWKDPWVEAKTEFVVPTLGRELERAQFLIAQQKYDEATAILTELGKHHPDNQRVLHVSAVLDRLQGQLVGAQQTLNRAMKLYPLHYPYIVESARIHVALQDPEAALEQLDRAIELDPEPLVAYRLKGELQMAAQDWEGAKATYFKGLLKQPEDPHLMLNMGWTEGMLDNWDKAAGLFQGVIALQPKMGIAYLNLARALGVMGEYDDAALVLEQATEVGTPPEHIESVQREIARIKSRRS